MKIEISNGELLDKLSILEIKLEKIKDPEKRINIIGEYSLLKPLADKLIPIVGVQFRSLMDVNRLLWEIEDTIRDFERNQQFGDDFIQTARKVYRFNDQRAHIKKEINRLTNSGLVEEKSYAGY
ncbi:MAG: DUF6165 family protein [Bacteroidia bacterium]|nr:DUF6165 family protein [Bacteroidia bacterium]